MVSDFPSSGTFTFPPAFRLYKSKEKQNLRLDWDFCLTTNTSCGLLHFSSVGMFYIWVWLSNKPNQSVIIGIINNWLTNNCLIMKWHDFSTTRFSSFQSKPLFTENHPKCFISHSGVVLSILIFPFKCKSPLILYYLLNAYTWCNIIHDTPYKCK